VEAAILKAVEGRVVDLLIDLAELAIEAFLPADAATRAALAEVHPPELTPWLDR